MFLKIWVGERNTGRIMNEPGKPFVDRYVTKGWKSATMERSGGKGTLGEIFLTLTLSSRPILKRIFGTISEGGGREEQLEWKHPKNPQKRTTEVIRCFFFFCSRSSRFIASNSPPPGGDRRQVLYPRGNRLRLRTCYEETIFYLLRVFFPILFTSVYFV